jgi:hypothetical protein
VPAGAVEHQNEVCIGQAGGGEFVEEDLHGGGVDRRQHQRDVLAGGWTNRREDVGPEIAELLKSRRTLAAPPPAMADPTLVADPGLIREPQLDPLVGILCADGFYLLGKPPFLKAS